MKVLKTERLILRGWRDDDLDAMAEVNGDPEVMRYIADGSVRDRTTTADNLAKWSRGWRENGFGLFAVEIADTGEMAGFTGLAIPEFLPEVLPAVEIGWRLGRRFWGHGYATEAATAALDFAFTECDLDRVVSIRHVDNVRSGRVMEKIGLAYAFSTVVPETRQPVAVHQGTRG
ncbi:N-acetyltransferase [Actinoplanes ianthinogenes]|uniref:N-acetyltransferase n=1 Tax=Actinoplanes ianthinogenes TaxID=122358 RepID=A0ABM7M672_9ACTN|nr:GNAT family N-acetyltransferase [Actinoplanes ianthinogenes]BCJ47144.1 N-acetyltransferase [Actinoplanes ianthinogenes]GGR51998.1 N-acetyltransferase [Actinoplanes ianthinogenes]